MPFNHCRSLGRLLVGPIAFVAGLLVATTSADAHKGNPWHSPSVLSALGFNTAYLTPSAEGVPTSFVYRYPVRPNTHGFVEGDENVIAVVPDSALADGIFTREELIAFASGDVYSFASPLEVTFSISASGYYHFLFGPGPESSILVLQPASNGTIEVVPVAGGTAAFVVQATAGDVHILKSLPDDYSAMVGWIGLLFPDARTIFEQQGIATDALPPLDPLRAQRIAHAMATFGFVDSTEIPDPYPAGRNDAPLLANVAGLGTHAFATAYLDPGSYTFEFDREPGGLVLDSLKTTILQVVPDGAFDHGFATEANVIAARELPTDTLACRLHFSVAQAGYYHVLYGPGEGGFIVYPLPDDSLPVSLRADDAHTLEYFRKLCGLQTVIARPWEPIAARPEILFPCFLADPSDIALHGLFSDLTVPLADTVAAVIDSLARVVVVDAPNSVPPSAGLLEIVVRPNPSRGDVRFTLTRAREPAHIEVLDLRGRILWQATRSSAESDSWETRWDGRDAQGRRAPRGIYWVRVMTKSAIGAAKLVLL